MSTLALAATVTKAAVRSSVLSVVKRDGSVVQFQRDRIVRAIALAIYDVRKGAANPDRSNPQAQFGLCAEDFALANRLASAACNALSERFQHGDAPGVEVVQDEVEIALLDARELEIVRAFISYRKSQASLRPIEHGENGLAEYIAESRYCRFSEELGRREVWAEGVGRVREMHLRRFEPKFVNAARVEEVVQRLLAEGVITARGVADAGGFEGLETEIRTAFALVEAKKVLPSMRSLQFGGLAIERANARMFNCAFSPANRADFFKEFFYLLLCGSGAGFSVQKHHIAKMPALSERHGEMEIPVQHFVVPDTVEGWADAVAKLFDSYVHGYKVEFSFHQIRPYGSILKTSGGRAPGHIPLKKALIKAETILAAAAGRQLRPIEVYDISMHLAKAVLSGGIRRSATICLFSHDDQEMASAKVGNWYAENEQRSASNNSAVLIRGEVTREQFDRLFDNLPPFDRDGRKREQFGEPGFYFAENGDIGCNPCVEIALNPNLVVTEKVRDQLIKYGYYEPMKIGDVLTGTQMCNLTTIAGSAAVDPDAFFRLVKSAAVIGTLQADYTDIPYLGPVTRVLNEREALIGVSICGILDHPKVLLDPETLRRGAEVVKTANAVIAALIGINRAARTTCVKPEGTSSLVLNSGSGISPHHSHRYFRRVQASSGDPVLRWFQQHNPHMVEKSAYDPNGATSVICFPVKGPAEGIYREDMTALRHLEIVSLVQSNWVMPGRAHTAYTDAHHNVSNTINVDDGDWNAARDFIWENRHVLTGIALLPNSGDKMYVQAPRESLATDGDIRKWNALVYTPVDYSKIPDKENAAAGSEHRGAATACSGGSCDVV